MGTPPHNQVEKNASRRYGEVTHIRFSTDEMVQLKTLAASKSTSVSDVVRRFVRSELGYLPVASNELRPYIEDTTEQLRRVGINFNQAVRAMNEGRVPYNEDLERALMAVGELVRRFRSELREMSGRPRKNRRPSS